MFEILTLLFWGWAIGRMGRGRLYTDNRRTPAVPQYNPTEYLNLRVMSPREFEMYCASWLEKSGYKCRLTRASGDGNVDIFVEEGGQTIGIAECKHHKEVRVGAKTVKVLYATMLEHRVSNGWVFSLNGFSGGAQKYLATLAGVQIRLVDGKTIVS